MIYRFAGADFTVVTGRAVANNACVVKHRIGKIRGVMAHGAILSCRQVINELANADHVIVTRRAVIDNTGMIIGASRKGTWIVTSSAIVSGWHVVGRLTERSNAMAGVAPSAHNFRAGMIDKCANEARYVMTIGAIGGGCYVI